MDITLFYLNVTSELEQRWPILIDGLIHFLRKVVIRRLNPFHSIVAFHIETSYMICIANRMTSFYM